MSILVCQPWDYSPLSSSLAVIKHLSLKQQVLGFQASALTLGPGTSPSSFDPHIPGLLGHPSFLFFFSWSELALVSQTRGLQLHLLTGTCALGDIWQSTF